MAMWSTTERRTTISLSAPSAPRLHVQPNRSPGSTATLLDGGWWPRSADPVAELPGLILALQARNSAEERGAITHVLLPVADWDSHPRRIRVDGPAGTRVVRLSWFDTLPAGLLTALCADGRRVDLLTVPPHTEERAAAAAMELAAHPDSFLHTTELLSAITTPTTAPTTAGSAAPAPRTSPITGTDQGEAKGDEPAPESIWESEGGRLKPLAGLLR